MFRQLVDHLFDNKISFTLTSILKRTTVKVSSKSYLKIPKEFLVGAKVSSKILITTINFQNKKQGVTK